ncbi:photosynthesis system II assembly factor YCF48-like protein [Zavarzinia compransoris]|nr:photosynthesis system II assembly factor YCF48-like protein [Zavarzinia compransoris]
MPFGAGKGEIAGRMPADGASRRQALALGAGALLAMPLMPRLALAAAPERLYPDPLFGIALDGAASVATGYHGAVAVSSGASWTAVGSGTRDLLRRVTRRPGGGYVAVSHRGRILESNAEGRDWRVIFEVPGVYLRAVAFASAAVGWAVGHNGLILMTRDGGKTWTESEIEDYAGRDKPRLSGIAALDESRAVVVGEFGVVGHTANGGKTWNVVTEQVYPTLLDVSISGDRGYAVGLNGTLLALSQKPGGGWAVEPQPTNTQAHMLAVAVRGSAALIAGNGMLLSLGRSGFQPASISPQVDLNYLWLGGVALGDDGRAVAVGQGGLILAAATAADTFQPAPIALATQEVAQ